MLNLLPITPPSTFEWLQDCALVANVLRPIAEGMLSLGLPYDHVFEIIDLGDNVTVLEVDCLIDPLKGLTSRTEHDVGNVPEFGDERYCHVVVRFLLVTVGGGYFETARQ